MGRALRHPAPLLAIALIVSLLALVVVQPLPNSTAARPAGRSDAPSPLARPSPSPRSMTLPAGPTTGAFRVAASVVPSQSVEPSPEPATPMPTRTPKPTPAPMPTRTPKPTPVPTPVPPPVPTPVPPTVTLVGAGDIASCASGGDEATAALLDAIPGTVFTTGDNVYEKGTPTEFAECYEPSWGRHRDRTRPVPGNHEYKTSGAAGYYDYFGSAAGNPARGWYAYNLGAWRIYALNSNCSAIGGCGAGSPQERWLRADLAAKPRACVLAYWHEPLFSSGEHGSSGITRPLYRALYEAGAELVLVGHDHDYERFAPQDPGGRLDRRQGLVQIVVGTGGKSLRPFGSIRPNSVARNATTYGVLMVSLAPESYAFEFVPVAGGSYADTGSRPCH